MIYLYDSTETDFRYNGKPLPTAYDVTVSNTLNSEYYVMGKYPLDKNKVYKELVEDRIIKVHTMDGMEPFRIVNVSKYELYVEFEAWPLFYADMRNKLVRPLNLKRVSGQAALNAFKNNLLIDTPFDFYSDITDNHDYHTQDVNERENNPKQLYNALDVFKTIVSRWGGELWIRGYDIRVNKRIGTDTEAMLYEKKNITEFVDTTNIEGIVTRLHGKAEWQDERQEGEEEGQKHSIRTTVDSPLIGDYSGVIFEKQYTNNDIRTERELKNWLNLKFTTENIDKPQRTIEVGTNVIDETKIGFADTLILKYIKHDTDVRIKVVGYEYDGFANELRHVVLGQPKHTSSSTIGNTITDLVNNVVEPVDRKTTIAMNSADGKSTVFHGTAEPNTLNLNAKENDTYFRTNGNEKEIWRFTGTLWELIMDTSDTTKNADAIEKTLEEVEEAKQQAKLDAEQALADAKGHADAEVSRIDTELSTEVGTAIDLAEEAKQDAIDKANQALADAKAHAEAEDARIKQEIGLEVDGAIEIAEQAKQDAIDKANQAYEDAKAHADAEILQFNEHFDGVLESVESDVADAQATADSVVEQIDTAVANAGFTSLDDTIQNISGIASGVKSELDIAIQNAGFTSLDDTLQNMNYITTNAEQNAQQAITNASNAYGLAQTSISEAQTAQANSLTALGKADNALDGVSNLDVRVDDVEAELELKADNTFMNEDGELTTLSNAITFNAHRFSSDMSRIESRVESLAGEINLVILRDAFEGAYLIADSVYPNPYEVGGSLYSDTMRELIEVTSGEQLALSKDTVPNDNYWRINFYGSNNNYISRVATLDNQFVLTVPSDVTKMWVSYPQNSRPQIVRGTNFIPYRPNMADQMTTDEMVVFRNEYDEFADKTERRLSAVDSTGGSLDILNNRITTEAGLVRTDMTALINTKVSDDDFAEFYQNEYLETAQEVSRKISLSDVIVGGRNLIKNSSFYNGFENWHRNSPTAVVDEAPGVPHPFVRINNQLDYAVLVEQNVDVESYTDYVFSYNLQRKGSVILAELDRDGTEVSRVTINNIGNYSRYSHKFKTSPNTRILRVVLVAVPEEHPLFYAIQLEKGNVLSDWERASEDIDTQLNHIQTEWTQTFDTFSQTVSSIDGRVTNQKQTIDGLETTVQSTQSDLSGTTTLLNQTKQTVDSRTSVLAELRTDVDGKATVTQFNTLENTVDGSLQRIGDAEGNITQIETRVNGLQTTVADKANQSQVTQLSDTLSSVVEYIPTNLVTNPSLESVEGWSIPSSITVGNYTDVGRSLTVKTPGARIYNRGGDFEPGKTYYISFKMHVASGSGEVEVGSDNDSNRPKVIVGEVSGNRSHQLVYKPTVSSSYFSMYFMNTGIYRFQDLFISDAPFTEEMGSQISQLSDNINLRVTKGDVVSQINIEAEQTLIQTGKLLLDAKNTIVTGDFAVSGNAIVGGDMQLNKGLRVMNGTDSVLSVVNGNVRMNVGSLFIGSEDVEDKIGTAIYQNSKSLGLIYTDEAGQEQSLLSIGADGVYVEGKHIILNGQTIVNDDFTIAGDMVSEGIDADNITTGTIDAARIDAKFIVTEGLEVDVIEAKHILADTATIDKLFADEANIDVLTSKEAFIDSIKAVEIDASKITSGTIDAARIDAKFIVAEGLEVDVIDAKHISADTALIDKLFADEANIDVLTSKTAFINSIKAVEIDADNITSGELDAGQITVVNLDVSSLSGNKAEFITASFNGINGYTQIDADGIYMQGSGVWRRTYLSSTGFRLYNAGTNKSGAMGYFKEHLSNTTSTEDYFAAEKDTKHYIGIGVNDTHHMAFGYQSDPSINRRYAKALQIDGDTGTVRLYTNLVSGNSTYGLRLRAYDSGGYYGTAWERDDSGILFATNGTYIWDYGGNTWDRYNMTNRQKIGFYGDSGIQTLTTNKNMEIWAGGSTISFYTSTNSQKFRISDGAIQAYTDIGMNGNVITGQSDERLKTNIRAREELIINKLKQFNFVDFDWIESGKSTFGVIAQQVQKFAPELVGTDETNMLTINNTLLNMYTTKSVVEINQKVDDLTESTDDKIHKLQQELSKANRRIEELEGAI